MADDKNGKLITDIMPQASQPASEDIIENTASIIKHASSSSTLNQTLANNNINQVSATDDLGADATKPSGEVSRKGNDLNTAETIPSSNTDSQDTTESSASTDIIDNETKMAESDTSNQDETRTNNPYEAIDSLPDKNNVTTDQTNDNAQGSKIYDTKEYFVPIKDTTHSHGGLGIVIAGVVSALVVLAIVVFVLLAKY